MFRCLIRRVLSLKVGNASCGKQKRSGLDYINKTIRLLHGSCVDRSMLTGRIASMEKWTSDKIPTSVFPSSTTR